MEGIIADDRALFLYLNNLGSKPYDYFWIWLSETWVWIPLYIILLYLLHKNFGTKRLVFLILFIVIGITISDQLAGIYKSSIMRLRPCNDPAVSRMMRTVRCGGAYGFYSSHASNTFFIANFMSVILGHRHRLLPYILFLWAGLVSYSRIYLGVHYPLDIVMGSGTGFLLGGLFATLADRSIKKLM